MRQRVAAAAAIMTLIAAGSAAVPALAQKPGGILKMQHYGVPFGAADVKCTEAWVPACAGTTIWIHASNKWRPRFALPTR